MNKKHFINLVICVLAGLFFSIGLCMCLLPEWNMLIAGIVITSIGGISLIIMGIIAYIKKEKTEKHINWKFVGKITYSVISILIIGLSMAMIMVWNLMLWGIVVGIVGIIMLLFLIPMFAGLKK